MSNDDKPSRRELERMRNDDLRTKCLDLGLEPSEDWQKSDLVEAIVKAGGSADDSASEQTAETAEGRGYRHDPSLKKPDADQQMYDVYVSSTDEVGGDQSVDVQINGYPRRIPRDTWVRVPESVVEVLTNAVNTRLEQEGLDHEGRPKWTERHARRFSFQAVPARN